MAMTRLALVATSNDPCIRGGFRTCRLATVVLLAPAVAALTGAAPAQDGTSVAVGPAEAAYRPPPFAADLTYPASAEVADQLTSPRMALLKPEGAGRFPAIVIMHQCSGPKDAVVSWAQKAVA